jgi:hypothetical protein
MIKTLGVFEKPVLLEFILKRMDASSGLAGFNKTGQTARDIHTF